MPPKQKTKIVLYVPDEAWARACAEATMEAGGWPKAERDRAERERLHKPGNLIEGDGIYIGKWVPEDRSGVSLRKIFNVYAAPADLPYIMTYAETVDHVAQLKNWHGHDGMRCLTDSDVYDALRGGSYNGGWIVPPRVLVAGTEVNGAEGRRSEPIIQPDNIFSLRHTGALRGTFKTGVEDLSGCPNWYWSSTEHGNGEHMWVMRFRDGYGGWDVKNRQKMNCRPVRLASVER